MFKLTPIALVLFITTAINLSVAYISWQRRKNRSGIYFTVGMICVTFWTLAVAFDYAAIPLEWKIFFAKAEAWDIAAHSPYSPCLQYSLQGTRLG